MRKILVRMLKSSSLMATSNPVFMSNIRNSYLIVLEVINSLNIDSYSPSRVGRKLKMADIEIVVLSLTIEFIDSENHLFRQLNNVDVPNLIERSQFNKRRRKLFSFSETVRLALASRLLLADKGYLSTEQQLDLFESASIVLETPMRMNQKGNKSAALYFQEINEKN